MANYEPRRDLSLRVARSLTPAMIRIGRIVEEEAKAAAPRDKHWVNVGDHAVRGEHRNIAPVPANLRFTLRSPEYDRTHYGVGAYQMGPRPLARDPRGINGFTPGLTVNCRCTLAYTGSSTLAQDIEAHPPQVTQYRVRVRITCDDDLAVEADLGTAEDHGARFMAHGLRAAARRLKAKAAIG